MNNDYVTAYCDRCCAWVLKGATETQVMWVWAEAVRKDVGKNRICTGLWRQE